jgi:Mn2+/Fe2+ NRAMP family transporter
MLFAQGANGILLPIIMLYLMRLVNNKELMGRYTNNRFYNIMAWGAIVGVIGVTLLLIVSSFYG